MLRNLAPLSDAGQAYSLAILSGREVGPFSKGEKGAGRIHLFWNDHISYDKISLNASEFFEVRLSIPAPGARSFRAAIWWPEYSEFDAAGNGIDTHNDINLDLLDSNGRTVMSSGTVKGVFERLAVPSLSGGTWTLRITAKTIRKGPQTIYYSTAVKY